MKTLPIALVAAFFLGSWSHLSAETYDIDTFSFGWFGTSGYYPVEYWVDVYDYSGTGLRNFSVSAHYESSNNWQTAETISGNSSHLTAHGYGDTVDDSTSGTIDFANGVEAVHRNVQFYF